MILWMENRRYFWLPGNDIFFFKFERYTSCTIIILHNWNLGYIIVLLRWLAKVGGPLVNVIYSNSDFFFTFLVPEDIDVQCTNSIRFIKRTYHFFARELNWIYIIVMRWYACAGGCVVKCIEFDVPIFNTHIYKGMVHFMVFWSSVSNIATMTSFCWASKSLTKMYLFLLHRKK